MALLILTHLLSRGENLKKRQHAVSARADQETNLVWETDFPRPTVGLSAIFISFVPSM